MQVNDEMLRAAREAYLEASDLIADAEPMRAALEAALSVTPAEAGWSTTDRREAEAEAHRRFGEWERSRVPEVAYRGGGARNGFILGAEWQKARTVPEERTEEGGVIASPTWPDGCRLTINELAHGGDEHIDCDRLPVPDTEEG